MSFANARIWHTYTQICTHTPARIKFIDILTSSLTKRLVSLVCLSLSTRFFFHVYPRGDGEWLQFIWSGHRLNGNYAVPFSERLLQQTNFHIEKRVFAHCQPKLAHTILIFLTRCACRFANEGKCEWRVFTCKVLIATINVDNVKLNSVVSREY